MNQHEQTAMRLEIIKLLVASAAPLPECVPWAKTFLEWIQDCSKTLPCGTENKETANSP